MSVVSPVKYLPESAPLTRCMMTIMITIRMIIKKVDDDNGGGDDYFVLQHNLFSLMQ